MTTVLKYPGGKRKLVPELLRHFPATMAGFVDAMSGSATVALAVREALPRVPIVLNDAQADVMTLYELVRDDGVNVSSAYDDIRARYMACDTMKLRGGLYRELRDQVRARGGDASWAAAYIAVNHAGFNGLVRYNRAGVFNTPFGQRTRLPEMGNRILSLMRFLMDCNTSLMSGDYAEAMPADVRGWVIYFDPPYDGDDTFRDYTAGGFNQEEQVRLARVADSLADRGAHCFLSNAATPAMEALYAQYGVVHRVSAPRPINRDGGGRGYVPELLLEIPPC